MDSVPLFEREHRKDSQLVIRLQNELADAKRFVEAQARRQNDLEYVNEDLERRFFLLVQQLWKLCIYLLCYFVD
jgi:hypothetical protein